MSSKPKGVYSDFEMLRAAQAQMRSTADEYRVVVAALLGLRPGSGRVYICVEARYKGTPGTRGHIARYEVDWPNTNAMSFTACVFQATVQLDRMMADNLRDTEVGRAQRQR